MNNDIFHTWHRFRAVLWRLQNFNILLLFYMITRACIKIKLEPWRTLLRFWLHSTVRHDWNSKDIYGYSEEVCLKFKGQDWLYPYTDNSVQKPMHSRSFTISLQLGEEYRPPVRAKAVDHFYDTWGAWTALLRSTSSFLAVVNIIPILP